MFLENLKKRDHLITDLLPPHEAEATVVTVATDAHLASAILLGDEEAFQQLYQRYVSKVRSTLVRLSGTHHLDDATQETFIRIWRNLDRLRAYDHLSTWIYRIATNVAMDQLRHKQRMPTLISLELSLDSPHMPYREREDEVGQYENRQMVNVALESLEFSYRSVLVLHDLEQLSEAEVAEILEIPLGTVKSRLFKARELTRNFLQQKGIIL